MKYGVVVLGILGLLGASGAALAQDGAVADATAGQSTPAEVGGTPKARVGFQMAVRTGYSVPMGKVAEGADMSNYFSGQVPIIVDIGGKVIPELFLGGYFGLGFGATAGDLKRACDDANASCFTLGLHLGVEAQYHILPHGSVNPWIGYGLGLESVGYSATIGNTTQHESLAGFEFARFSGGVDFRVSKVFGVGPFVDFSMGKYSSANDGDTSIDIPNTAAHQWLTLGARFVIFP
jgi:hypothetical protein